MKDFTHLILDPAGEALLRNLSISPKKWSTLMMELSDLCGSANTKEAINHLIEEASSVIKLKSSPIAKKDNFDEHQSKRIQKVLTKLQGLRPQLTAANVNSRVFSGLIASIRNDEKDADLAKAIESLAFANSRVGRKKSFKGKSAAVVAPVVDTNATEDLDFSIDLLNFVEYAIQSDSLTNYLLVLKLILFLFDQDDKSDFAMVRSQIPRIVQQLSTYSVLGPGQLKQLCALEEEREHMHTFENTPRVLLTSGHPTKLSTYEVQGKGIGIVAGICVKPSPLPVPLFELRQQQQQSHQQCSTPLAVPTARTPAAAAAAPLTDNRPPYPPYAYYEATLKGRGFSGVRIGWSLCGAELGSHNTQLGNNGTTWAFEGFSGYFFHDASEVSQARKLSESQRQRQQSLSLSRACSVGGEDELEGSLFAGLFNQDLGEHGNNDEKDGNSSNAQPDSGGVAVSQEAATGLGISNNQDQKSVGHGTTDESRNLAANTATASALPPIPGTKVTSPPAAAEEEEEEEEKDSKGIGARNSSDNEGSATSITSRLNSPSSRAQAFLDFMREEDKGDITSIRRMLMTRAASGLGTGTSSPSAAASSTVDRRGSNDDDNNNNDNNNNSSSNNNNPGRDGGRSLSANENDDYVNTIERDSKSRIAHRSGGRLLTEVSFSLTPIAASGEIGGAADPDSTADASSRQQQPLSSSSSVHPVADGGTNAAAAAETVKPTSALNDYAWTAGSVLGCLLIPHTGDMHFFLDGVCIGSAPVQIPMHKMLEDGVCPVFSCNPTAGLELNVGQTRFQYEKEVIAHLRSFSTKRVGSNIISSSRATSSSMSPDIEGEQGQVDNAPAVDRDGDASLSPVAAAEDPSKRSTQLPPPSISLLAPCWKRNSFLSLHQSYDASICTTGSGIVVSNFTTDTYKFLTFEASARLHLGTLSAAAAAATTVSSSSSVAADAGTASAGLGTETLTQKKKQQQETATPAAADMYTTPPKESDGASSASATAAGEDASTCSSSSSPPPALVSNMSTPSSVRAAAAAATASTPPIATGTSPDHRYCLISCAPSAQNNFQNQGPTADDYGCSFGVDRQGCVFFAVHGGGGESVKSPPDTCKEGRWYHLAVTYSYHRSSNKATVCLLVNGSVVAQNDLMHSKKSRLGRILPRFFCIGGQIQQQKKKDLKASNSGGGGIVVAPNNHTWPGDVCEVRVWSTARSADRIANTMGRGRISGVEPELVSMFPLEEGSGDRVHDAAVVKNVTRQKETIVLHTSSPGSHHWGAMPAMDANHADPSAKFMAMDTDAAVAVNDPAGDSANSLSDAARAALSSLIAEQNERAERGPPAAGSLDDSILHHTELLQIAQSVVKKLLVSCDKVTTTLRNVAETSPLMKSYSSLPQMKAVLGATDLNFRLLNSLLKQAVSFFHSQQKTATSGTITASAPSVTLTSTTMSVFVESLFSLLRVNVRHINKSTASSASSAAAATASSSESHDTQNQLSSDMAASLLVSLLYFVSGCTAASAASSSGSIETRNVVQVLRKAAVSTILSGLDYFIPSKSNQLFALECLAMQRNRDAGSFIGNSMYHEAASMIMSSSPEVFHQQLPEDPLVALLSLSPEGRTALFQGLCEELSTGAYITYMVPHTLHPVVASAAGEASVCWSVRSGYVPVACADVLPKPGDQVQRGPHWKYGDQDGGAGSIGIVIEVGQWLQDSLRDCSRVFVEWKNGNRNNYAYGVIEAAYTKTGGAAAADMGSTGSASSSTVVTRPEDEGLAFHICILRPKKDTTLPSPTTSAASMKAEKVKNAVASPAESNAAAAASLSPEYERRELSFTLEEVNQAMNGGGGGGPITKRSVLYYMKEVAPIEWQDKHRIGKPANALLSKFNGSDISAIYAEFYRTFSSSGLSEGSTSSIHGAGGHKKKLQIEPRYGGGGAGGIGSSGKSAEQLHLLSNNPNTLLQRLKRLIEYLVFEVSSAPPPSAPVPQQAPITTAPDMTTASAAATAGETLATTSSATSNSTHSSIASRSGNGGGGGGEAVNHSSNVLLSGPGRLLTVLHAVLMGVYSSHMSSAGAGSTTTKPALVIAGPDSRIARGTFCGKDGTTLEWDWRRGIWREHTPPATADGANQVDDPGKEAKEQEESASAIASLTRGLMSEKAAKLLGASNTTSASASSGSNSSTGSVKLLTDLNIDKSYLGGNLFIKSRIRTLEIIQAGDREWNTCNCTIALQPYSGIYRWYVRIKNFTERRGHCMLGVATTDFSYDEFLGQHQESWGLSPNLDLFHGGRKRRTESERKLTVGSTVEITLDTYKGTLYFAEILAESPSGGHLIEPLGFDNLEGVVVYPAFSLYSPGDCFSIITNADDIKSMKLRDASLRAMARKGGSSGSSSSGGGSGGGTATRPPKVVMLGAPQPTVIAYGLQLIRCAGNVLSASQQRDHTSTSEHKSDKNSDGSIPPDYCSNPVLSVNLLHWLSTVQKWKHAPHYLAKEMMDAMVRLIDQLRSALVYVRGLAGGVDVDGAEQEEATKLLNIHNCELLVELICLTTSYAGRLAASWIARPLGYTDNECLAAQEQRASSSSAASPASNEDSGASASATGTYALTKLASTEQTQTSPNSWLNHKLFSRGFRADATQITNGFLRNACYGDSAFDVFVRWISLHDRTHKNFRRFGGEAMDHPVKVLFAVVLYHAGYLQTTTHMQSRFTEYVKEIIAQGKSVSDECLLAIRPAPYIMHCWEAAMKVRVWAKEVAGAGVAYEFIASKIVTRCLFLLELEPCISNRQQPNLSSFSTSASNNKASTSAERNFSAWLQALFYPDSKPISSAMPEKSLQQIIVSVKLFVTEPGLSLLHLRAAVATSTTAALLRRDGFRAVRAALGNLASTDIGCGAKCVLIAHLPRATKGGIVLEASAGSSITSLSALLGAYSRTGGGSAAISTSSAGDIDGRGGGGHYSDGLDGISQSLRLEMQGTFDAYYACLNEELSSCSYDDDCAYQLSLLDCLGVRILEQDHTLLSRVNFFFSLQEILENSLSLLGESIVTNQTTAESVVTTSSGNGSGSSAGVNGGGAVLHKFVVKAAMKLFILMALQVATTRDEEQTRSYSLSSSSVGGGISLGVGASSFGHPVALNNNGGSSSSHQQDALHMAPVLRKTKSGPGTLSKSVFDILFAQLSEVANAILDMYSESLNMPLAISSSSSSSPSLQVDTGFTENFVPALRLSQSATLLTSEATTLLLCVSKNTACQRILLRPKWLTLLLQMAVSCTSVNQQRAILLLSDLLTGDVGAENVPEMVSVLEQIEFSQLPGMYAIGDDEHSNSSIKGGGMEEGSIGRNQPPSQQGVEEVEQQDVASHTVSASSSSARIVQIILTLIGNSLLRVGAAPLVAAEGSEFMKEITEMALPVVSEAVALLRKLYLSPVWNAVVERIFITNLRNGCALAPVEVGATHNSKLLSINRHLLATLCVLGGQIEAPYHNCPVVFQHPSPDSSSSGTTGSGYSAAGRSSSSDDSGGSSSLTAGGAGSCRDLGIGVFTDFHDTPDKVLVTFHRYHDGPITAGQSPASQNTIVLPLDKVQAINRCPIEKMLFSSDIIAQVVVFVEKHILTDNSGETGSKVTSSSSSSSSSSSYTAVDAKEGVADAKDAKEWKEEKTTLLESKEHAIADENRAKLDHCDLAETAEQKLAAEKESDKEHSTQKDEEGEEKEEEGDRLVGAQKSTLITAATRARQECSLLKELPRLFATTSTRVLSIMASTPASVDRLVEVVAGMYCDASTTIATTTTTPPTAGTASTLTAGASADPKTTPTVSHGGEAENTKERKQREGHQRVFLKLLLTESQLPNKSGGLSDLPIYEEYVMMAIRQRQKMWAAYHQTTYLQSKQELTALLLEAARKKQQQQQVVIQERDSAAAAAAASAAATDAKRSSSEIGDLSTSSSMDPPSTAGVLPPQPPTPSFATAPSTSSAADAAAGAANLSPVAPPPPPLPLEQQQQLGWGAGTALDSNASDAATDRSVTGSNVAEGKGSERSLSPIPPLPPGFANSSMSRGSTVQSQTSSQRSLSRDARDDGYDFSEYQPDNDDDDDANQYMIESMVNMGFPPRWCEVALDMCGGDPEEALNYILTNSAQLEEMMMSIEQEEAEAAANPASSMLRRLAESETMSASIPGTSNAAAGRGTGGADVGASESVAETRNLLSSTQSASADAGTTSAVSASSMGGGGGIEQAGATAGAAELLHAQQQQQQQQQQHALSVGNDNSSSGSSNAFNSIVHFIGSHNQLLAFYAEPSRSSERLGCVFPGDDLSVVEVLGDVEADPTNVWYKLPYADFDDGNYHSSYGDELFEMFVWVPKYHRGVEVIREGSYEGGMAAGLGESPGESIAIDKTYKVIGVNGALVRQGVEISSTELASISSGELVHACEETFNSDGTLRLRLDSPIQGWISKLFGLVQLVEDPASASATGLAQQKNEAEVSTKRKESEFGLLQNVDDNMEFFSANDAYNREYRYFGSMQGNQYTRYRDREKSMTQTLYNKRMRISGMSSYSSYAQGLSNHALSHVDSVIAELLNTLQKLYCRKIMLALLLRDSIPENVNGVPLLRATNTYTLLRYLWLPPSAATADTLAGTTRASATGGEEQQEDKEGRENEITPDDIDGRKSLTLKAPQPSTDPMITSPPPSSCLQDNYLEDVVAKFYTFMRMVVFRGEPYSFTRLEKLGFDDLFVASLAEHTNSLSVEQVLDRVVLSMISPSSVLYQHLLHDGGSSSDAAATASHESATMPGIAPAATAGPLIAADTQSHHSERGTADQARAWFIETILESVAKNVRLAVPAKFSDHVWADSTYEEDLDDDIIEQPNMHYAAWITRILLNIREEAVTIKLFACWVVGLRATSLSLKQMVAVTLTEILGHVRNIVNTATAAAAAAASEGGGGEESYHRLKEESAVGATCHKARLVLQACLSLLPIHRLKFMATKRLWAEMEDAPAFSRFLQSLLHFLSEIEAGKVLLSAEVIDRSSGEVSPLPATTTAGTSAVSTAAKPLLNDQDASNMSPLILPSTSNQQQQQGEAETPQAAKNTTRMCALKERPFIKLKDLSSYVQLSPQKEVAGPWTVECWLRRRSTSHDSHSSSSSSVSSSSAEALHSGTAGSSDFDTSKASASTSASRGAAGRRGGMLDSLDNLQDLLSAELFDRNELGAAGMGFGARGGGGKAGLTGLLNLLLGTNAPAPGGGGGEALRDNSSTATSGRNKTSTAKNKEDEKTSIPSMCLLSSSKGTIRIQAGGRIFDSHHKLNPSDSASLREFEDPQQKSDPVHEEALCLSVATSSGSEKKFDCVVPSDRWVHLSIVCQTSPMSLLTVYLDGEVQDSISMTMNLPLSVFGSMQSGSFVGDLAELRVWSIARTRGEIVRDMDVDVAGARHLLSHLTCSEGRGALTHDMAGIFNSCKLHNCGWVHSEPAPACSRPDIPDFMLTEIEEAEGIFGAEIGSGAHVVEMTGVFKFQGVSGAQGELSNDFSEVVSLSYRKVPPTASSTSEAHHAIKEAGEESSSNCPIEGYLFFCERDVRCRIAGTMSSDGAVHFGAFVNSATARPAVIVGPPENLDWLRDLQFDGSLLNGTIRGSFSMRVMVDTAGPVSPGNSRLDIFSLPPEIHQFASVRAAFKGHLLVKEGSPEGQYVATVEIAPYPKLLPTPPPPPPPPPPPQKENLTSATTTTAAAESGHIITPPPSTPTPPPPPPITTPAAAAVSGQNAQEDQLSMAANDSDAPAVVVAAATGSGDQSHTAAPSAMDSDSAPTGPTGEDPAAPMIPAVAPSGDAVVVAAGSASTPTRENVEADEENQDGHEIKNAEAEAEQDREVDDDDIDTYGICENQGSMWIEWLVNANCGNLAFGACTADALVHPDACVDANDETWTYSLSGQASHGANLFLCDTAEEGDTVSMHIDSDQGTINFYKNYEFVVGFEHVNEHPKMKLSYGRAAAAAGYSTCATPAGDDCCPPSYKPGIRPFVSLVAAGDSVSYLGVKEGPVDIIYAESDPQGRGKFSCKLVNGAFDGYGLLGLHTNTERWFGLWRRGKETGLHIRVDNIDEQGGASAGRKYDQGALVRELNEEQTSQEPDVSELVAAYYNVFGRAADEQQEQVGGTGAGAGAGSHPQPETLPPADSGEETVVSGEEDASAAATAASGSSSQAADSIAARLAQLQSSTKITIAVHDSTGENSYFKVMRSVLLSKLFTAYASKKDSPVSAFVFKYNNTVLEGNRSMESYDIDNNAVIQVSVKSLNVSSGGESRREELESYITTSTAPYVLQIVYESGALVRSGIEIETSSIRTLKYGEVIEAFQKTQSSEGVGRFRVADGWISEKLRGGNEARVVVVLSEKLKTPVKYRVIREEGARIRRQPSLSSEDIGFCPFNTVISTTEVRYVYNTASLAATTATGDYSPPTRYSAAAAAARITGGAGSTGSTSDCTVRVRIASPASWEGGWASVKEHILERVVDSAAGGLDGSDASGSIEDPIVAAERTRRQRIRAQRKVKAEMIKSKEKATRRRQRLATASGSLDVSQETFFLLKRRKSGSSAQVSSDFSTVTCDGSGGSGRSMVLGSRGFVRGVHYWEVQVNAANWGSVFIGVAPGESNSWSGYGLLNYRATQAFGSETLYGSYFSVGDKVGVLLDMDHGTISFFKDGDDFNVGRVTVSNMGVAYHNLRRVGSRSSNSILYPCFGVKSSGDQLSILRQHWVSSRGLAPHSLLQRVLHAKNLLSDWYLSYTPGEVGLSEELIRNTFEGYKSWSNRDMIVISSRPGIDVVISTSAEAIAIAAGSSALVAQFKLCAGKIVRTQYGDGKILGARRNQLWYSYEGAEHMAWYWRTDELPDLLDSAAISFDVAPTSSGSEESVGDGDGNESSMAEGSSSYAPVSDAAAARAVSGTPGDDGTVSGSNAVQDLSAVDSGAPTLDYKTFHLGLRPTGQSPTTISTSTSSSSSSSETAVASTKPWSLEEDAAISRIVNSLANKYGADPLRVSGSDLEMHIAAAGVLPGRSTSAVKARYAALCALNKAAAIALPFADFNNGDNRVSIFRTDLLHFDICQRSPSTQPCTESASGGGDVVRLRSLIFTQTKMGLWQFAMKESTTTTNAPADEYERPDDLREITINRVEARNAEKAKESLRFPERLRISVFGQLMANMQGWDERSLRRAYVHMQDAGQGRAFFVKFAGEGVDDQGGPYRAVFQTAVGEEVVQLLDLLVPCPNAVTDIGENRDKYVINSELCAPHYASVYTHLGRLIAIACRHHVLVPLSLPSLFWKALSGEAVSARDLEAVDATAMNSLRAIMRGEYGEQSADDSMIPGGRVNTNSTPSDSGGDDVAVEVDQLAELLVQALMSGGNFVGGSTGRQVALYTMIHQMLTASKPTAAAATANSNAASPSMDRRSGGEVVQRLVELVQQLHLTSQSEGLRYIFKGLSAVVPTELLPMFTASELEGIFCGEADIDISVLQKATIYESVSPTDRHIQYFWEAVRDLDREERSQLINFCSGRSRLPAAAADFPMNFKLTAPPPAAEKDPDEYLPIARTCFFSLSLPKYTSKEVCMEKLKYAIRNTELMDADFIDRRSTGWENVR